MPGFRHVVLLELRDLSESRRQAILDGLAALPAAIPTIRHYEFGFDAGLAGTNADLAIVADFDDEDGYRTYADHPAHQAFIADHLRAVLAGRTAVQHRRT